MFVIKSHVFVDIICICINCANARAKNLGDFRWAKKCRLFSSKMAAVRGVMIDLSGTLHVENTVIPGSIEASKRYFI